MSLSDFAARVRTGQDNYAAAVARARTDGAERAFHVCELAVLAACAVEGALAGGMPYEEALDESVRPCFDLREAGPADAALFCRRLAERLPAADTPCARILTRTMPGNRMVYVRNYYADRVFSAFEGRCAGLTARYVDSFHSAVYETAAERADFCILPLGGVHGNRLAGTDALTERYGLKLIFVAQLQISDREHMRYGVFARLLPHPQGSACAEFFFSGGALADVLTSLEQIGAQLVSLHTLPPLSYYAGGERYRICVQTGQGDLDALLLLVLLYVGAPSVEGLYPGAQQLL